MKKSSTKAKSEKARTPVGNLGIKIILPSLLLLTGILGCKKGGSDTSDDPSYYGYGSLSVTCEKKCHVSFGEPGKLNDYDVEATTSKYVFRYQSRYNIDINITAIDADQNMVLSVYSREQYQIFKNTVRKKQGETWNTKILVP